MSDIFISYARSDQVLAEALANDLKACGFHVWWDAELVGSDDFYEVILQALNNAKAVIVIWTKASARSKFVYDEARFADHLKKLVATKDPSFDLMDIPFGFGRQHTDDVTDREKIIRAINKLGVKQTALPMARDWEQMKTSSSIHDIVDYIGSNPPEPQREAAVARLNQLAARPESAKGNNAIVHSLTMGRWRAFLLGLTFRLPHFQLSSQGTAASFGLALAYVAISFLAIVATVTAGMILSNLEIDGRMGVLRIYHIVLLFQLAIAALIYWRLKRFAVNRLFIAAGGTIYLTYGGI